MRPILPGNGGQELVVGDSNLLYQNAMLHNKVLAAQVSSKLLPPDEQAKMRENLHLAVGAVIGTNDTDNQKLLKRNVKGFLEHLTGKTTPKSSFFHQKLLSRKQDLSGRGTIAPDVSLGPDQIGLPEDMLWDMFSKFVIARLVRRGFGAVQAKEMVEKRHPAAHDALLAEAKERPVIFNRAPTLHRYGIVGAYATPVTGKTIRINPAAEKGLGADYDGDAIQIHAPVSAGAIADVKRMLLSNLIFSDSAPDQLMHGPAMESALGLYRATGAMSSAKVKKFKNKEAAMYAYRHGEVGLNDEVEIGK